MTTERNLILGFAVVGGLAAAMIYFTSHNKKILDKPKLDKPKLDKPKNEIPTPTRKNTLRPKVPVIADNSGKPALPRTAKRSGATATIQGRRYTGIMPVLIAANIQ